jgi:hypothetical protein
VLHKQAVNPKRRWLLVTIVVGVVVAVLCAVAFAAFRAERGRITAMFIGYTLAGNGQTPVARLTLSNGLSRPVRYYRNVGSGFVRCEFSDRQGSDWTNWVAEHNLRGVHDAYALVPGQAVEVTGELRLDGGERRFGILCVEERRQLPGPLTVTRSWLDRRGWWPGRRGYMVWNSEPVSSPLVERTNAPPVGSNALDGAPDSPRP